MNYKVTCYFYKIINIDPVNLKANYRWTRIFDVEYSHISDALSFIYNEIEVNTKAFPTVRLKYTIQTINNKSN